MKNLFLTKTRWLVTIILLTALGSGNVWGADETLTITRDDVTTANNYGKDSEWKVGTISGKCQIYGSTTTSLQFNGGKPNGTEGTGASQVIKSRRCWNTTSMPGKIKSITITTASGTNRAFRVFCSTSAATSSSTATYGTEFGSSATATTKGTTWDVPNNDNTDYRYFMVYENATSAAYIASIVVTYESAPATPHTVTFTKTDGSTQEITEASAGAGVTPPVMSTPCDGWAFQGWSTSQSTSTTSTAVLSTVTITDGKYYPSSDVTLYPVYTKTEDGGGEPVETKTQTFQYDTWEYGGSSTNKSSYRLFHNGGYVESASNVDFSKLSKVIVYGGTFGGTSYKGISIKKADGTLWKDATVSGSSETGTNTITGGASLTGSAKLRVYSTSGTASGTGVRISKVEVYTMEGGSTTYYYSYPNCCTPLGSINGSF